MYLELVLEWIKNHYLETMCGLFYPKIFIISNRFTGFYIFIIKDSLLIL